MIERDFEAQLDEWIANFRAEARRQFASGCQPADVLSIAMAVANSKQNRSATERRKLVAPIDVLPRM